MPPSVLTFAYLQYTPSFAESPVAFGAGVAVVGRATVGRRSHFGTLAAIRADGHFVTVGDDFWLGPRSTIHIAHEALPTNVGHNVTVGINSTVHACTVGDHCVVEDNVVILDGAKVGEGCVIASGSVVFPRAELPAGHWCEGSPAKPIRPLTPEQLAAARERIRGLTLTAPITVPVDAGTEGGPSNYVAPTAKLSGRVILADEASVWLSCLLDAAGHEISVGPRSNVQDNTVIRADAGPVKIGADVTVGHNVTLQNCTIGDRALIGIGSVLAPGTVVENDVLLAAGSVTLPGQRLTADAMWAGKPARRLGPLDDAKRKIIAYGAAHYCVYNRDFLAGKTA